MRKLFSVLVALCVLLAAASALADVFVAYDMDYNQPDAVFFDGVPFETTDVEALTPGYVFAYYPCDDIYMGRLALTVPAGRTYPTVETADMTVFPTAKVIREFELESPDGNLGFDKDSMVKPGDTVVLLGATTGRWYVYVNGHYASIPVTVYGETDAGYLEVDAAVVAEIEAAMPEIILDSREFGRLCAEMEDVRDEDMEQPWLTQEEEVAWQNKLWQFGYLQDTMAVPVPEGAMTEQEAIDRATAYLYEHDTDWMSVASQKEIYASYREVRYIGERNWFVYVIINGMTDIVCVNDDMTFVYYSDHWQMDEGLVDWDKVVEEEIRRGVIFDLWTLEEKDAFLNTGLPTEQELTAAQAEEIARAALKDTKVADRADTMLCGVLYDMTNHHLTCSFFEKDEEGEYYWMAQVTVSSDTGELLLVVDDTDDGNG